MYVILLILRPIIYGALYRLRGMSHAQRQFTPNWWNDTCNRIFFYALPITLDIAYILHTKNLPMYWALGSFLGAFATICIGHSSCSGNSWKQYSEMTALMLLRMIAVVFPIIYVLPNAAYAVYATLLTFPACWLGWNDSRTITFGINWTQKGDSSCEELAIGALVIGTTLNFVSLL